MKWFGILVIGSMMIFSCAGQRPENLGVTDGRLTNCPSKPNCVNSQAADEKHAIVAFRYQDNKEAALKRLKKSIASLERISLVTEKKNYLHFECKSKIMGFIDDMEFFFPEEKIIHVRSASRLGYTDFGTNRNRVEQIRKQFTLN